MTKKFKVFVGYRRADSGGDAGRIFDRLEAHFGAGHIFKDVDSIPSGVRFRHFVRESIERCDVFLALIGPSWLNATGENGERRLDHPDDLVRVEIETALSLPQVKVVPVLVAGATMPRTEDLPPSLRSLPELNSANVRRDPDFNVDMARLIRGLDLGASGTAISFGPSEPSAAARVWQEIKDSSEAGDFRRFIEAFSGSAEAFSAQRALDALETQSRRAQDIERAFAAAEQSQSRRNLMAFATENAGSPLADKAKRLADALPKEVRELRLALEIAAHSDDIQTVEFSHDGTMLVTAGYDNTVKIWNAQDGTHKLTFRGHKSYVSSASFSPNDAYIVTTSWDETSYIFETASGKTVTHIKAGARARRAKFSPSGDVVVTSGGGPAAVWSLDGEKLWSLDVYGGAYSGCADFSPDGAFVFASASHEPIVIRIWDVSTRNVVATLNGQEGFICDAQFSADGSLVAAASNKGSTLVWDKDGKVLSAIKEGGGTMWTNTWFHACAFSPDADLLALASSRKDLVLWDWRNRREYRRVPAHRKDVTSVAFSRDGTRIATASNDHTVKVWALERDE